MTVIGVAALGGATALVALLQNGRSVPHPSAVYILAVAVVALVGGRMAVLLAAVASFLLYDLFFVDPRFTFTASDPGEWLNLVLLLAVGLLVGQLAALLQNGLGVPNPSAVYILAVAVVALVGGRMAVLLAAADE